MSETMKCELDLLVHAGPCERQDVIVDAPFSLDNLLWHAGMPGCSDPYSLTLTDRDSGMRLPVQHEGGNISFVLSGRLEAGKERALCLSCTLLRSGTAPTPPAKNSFADRVVVTDLGRALLFSQNDRELCRYNYRDPWKPFFYPIYGFDGNVVRDRLFDAEDHHFHHGLWVAYGSMDHNSANLWCEDNRLLPRRGPAGRIVHQSFEQLTFGWVNGLVRQRLNYCKPDGETFARELRTLRVFAPTPETQLIDWTIRLEEPVDTGYRGMMFACRVAPSIRIVDMSDGFANRRPMERPGKIEFGDDEAWVDFSGPVGDGWDGIALFDHPSNPGFPGKPAAAEYGLLSFGREYPQDDEHRGGQ